MIKSITSLRGIFIILIFLHHCLELYPGGGSLGVAFFFVLSGFSMTLGYLKKVNSPLFSFKTYISKRCFKFFPLHWLCLIISVPLVVRSISFSQLCVFGVNAALLQSWFPVKDIYFSFNAVSWYLADTLFLAFVFPFILKLIIKSTLVNKTLIAICSLSVYILISVFLPADYYHAILYICPIVRLFDFVFGIYVALVFLKIKDLWNAKLSGWVNDVVIILLIALLIVESVILAHGGQLQLFAPLYWPLIAILILFVSFSEVIGDGSFLQSKILFRIGELSFVIYMIHQLVLRYISIIFDKILHYNNDVVYVILTFAISVIFSILIEKFFLKPIIEWQQKRKQQSMTALS